jgi:hypothetical protein
MMFFKDTIKATLLQNFVAACLLSSTLVLPACAYDLQYRQNGTNFTANQLRLIFNGGLPAEYDRQFPDQRWTTYLFLDAHENKGLAASGHLQRD